MNKRKILIITEYFYPEEFKINEIAVAWQEKGYIVDVLTTVPSYPESKIFDRYKNKLYQKDSWNGITIYRVKAITGYKTSLFKKLLKYFSFTFFATILSIRIGKNYDYIFGFNMASLTGMVPAIVIKKLYKIPLTFWTQDIWPDSVYAYGFKKTKVLSFILDTFVSFIYNNIDAIAISSQGFEEKLKPYSKKGLIFHYLPNWADDLDINMEVISLGDRTKIHFTFAGNIGKVQNLDNIIKAFNNLDIQYQKKAQLNIIGDGSALDDLKQINKNNNVIFHGRKLRNKMAGYYKASDFLIVSLVNEPIFSITVPAKTQTYIKAKKPILAIINGDTANIIKENNLGYTAKPNDIVDIQNCFKKAINSNMDEIKQFTLNCDNLTNSVFNKDIIINKLLKLTVRGL